ncbi:hypothetical protein ACYQR9_21680 [Methylobacterium sp. CM6241]
MALSYHGRREALEEGFRSLGYRISVTGESDRTATVFIEDMVGWEEQTTYEDYEMAMAIWEARLAAAFRRRDRLVAAA